MTSGHTDQGADEESLAAFLKQEWPVLYEYVRHRVNDTHRAEDVRQQTATAFILLWRARAGIEAAEAAPLLYGIANKKVADHFRFLIREHKRTSPLTAPPWEHGNNGHDLADPSGEDWLDGLLQRMVGATRDIPLTDRQQQAIELHCLEGRQQDETARIMGVSISTVQKHLAAARTKLRKWDVSDQFGISTDPKEAR
ncbi:RNA polymerase sigma factor [Actinokineospora diospyrosa]|uniref:RNA polymerase sigma-70 factor, ECF subfamily n=1 Tax=Actinokineospora diospyrosa TaxID=103728 RepID=A0ABT1IHA7_9PSEU|nr:RNA polymerase sigma factor [Actinokineospora diospyrosa]MCP2272035.1 RNA polymerase sigma-70 factor, ECF subfamily [Actinokineospora diospyrosa]